MGKKVLLIAPPINDLYKDIVSQLKRWGMEVDFIEDRVEKNDPDYIRNGWNYAFNNVIGRKKIENVQEKKWREYLNKPPYDKPYDYLFVIDGLMLSPYLFRQLRERNANLWAVNYLFDSTRSLYRFQNRFHFFDMVASFDKRDCEKFGLYFLPIYWCEPDEPTIIEYDLFGFGTYGNSRYELFKKIDQLSKTIGLKSYVKLYCKEIEDIQKYNIKRSVRKILGLHTFITLEHYKSNLITHQLIPSENFRHLVYSSRITIDSVNFNQDGMTARFMWALGAGKKIITTNSNIIKYDCYNPAQIYVVGDSCDIFCDSFVNFLQTDYKPTTEQKEMLLPWRIDNWLSTLLNNN